MNSICEQIGDANTVSGFYVRGGVRTPEEREIWLSPISCSFPPTWGRNLMEGRLEIVAAVFEATSTKTRICTEDRS